MTVDMNDPVVRSIVEARVNLLFKKPFFGNLALRLNIQEGGGWCKTAATDGRNLYYNRDFIKSLTKAQLIFLIAHEILHCVYDHLGRRGNRQKELWNMANDYIVNYTLKKGVNDDQVGEMPPNGLFSEKYTDQMTSEEVYKLLEENSVKIQATLDQHLESAGEGDEQDGSGNEDQDDEGKGRGQNTKKGKGNQQSKSNKKITTTVTGEDGPPKLSKEDLEKIRNEMKAAVIQAAQAVGAGNVPAAIRRLIADLTEPKLDWKQLLEMHMQSAIKDDYTFRKLSRRSWASGGQFLFPGQNLGHKVEAFCWIDMSGSISDEMARDFLSEVKGIMETFQDFTLHVATFDTQSYGYKIFTPDNALDILNYEPKGGGGTDFLAMDRFMKKMNLEPERVVVFTDGYPFGEWGDPTFCPDTLWIIHYDDTVEPPYGQKVVYNTEHKIRRR